MKRSRHKRGTDQKEPADSARARHPGPYCEHCDHELTLDEILFVEDGVYATYQVREDDGSLGFELDEIDGDADTYFTCRYCGEPLEEITGLWRSGREVDIIKFLQ